MFSHAHQDATGSRTYCATSLLDIRHASFTHGGGLHQRRPALFMEILEMRLDTFGERITLRSRGLTELSHVARTSCYGRENAFILKYFLVERPRHDQRHAQLGR
jgi:hypothetical protein